MVPDQITLERKTWRIGDQIGSGGFGYVCEAVSGDDIGAAKFVPKKPGAEREVLIANLSGRRNIVPVIDTGEHEDYWVIVMPRASKSLNDYMNEHDDLIPLPGTLTVLRHVATALVEIRDEIVHRDIKPANVLLLGDEWCLSDFGISRYAEQSTDPHTRKYAHTPPYTTPERWRSERATGASDMYSLGVMAYELIAGQLPFIGPDTPDFREQHLEENVQPIPGVSPLLDSLVRACLHKAPEARPTPQVFLTRLVGAERQQPSPGLLRLQQANQAQLHRQTEEAANVERQRSEEHRRASLFDAASQEYLLISKEFREALQGAAPDASLSLEGNGGWAISMNGAVLRMGPVRRTNARWWEDYTEPRFEVIAHSEISVRNRKDYEYKGKGHSLWYCDALTAGEFHWYETAFMDHVLMTRVTTGLVPNFFDPSVAASKAVASGMNEYQVAWPFTTLIPGDSGEFFDRWGGWFADAANQGLPRPHTLPERTVGNWRK